jgi:SET domain-containing protein
MQKHQFFKKIDFHIKHIFFNNKQNQTKQNRKMIDYCEIQYNKHGRGLYATKDIEKGEIILFEKAIVFPELTTEFSETIAQENGTRLVMNYAVETAKQSENILEKLCPYELDKTEIREAMWQLRRIRIRNITDEMCLNYLKIKRNCFSFKNQNEITIGILKKGTYFNYNSEPNVFYKSDYETKMVIFVANRDIKKGEEYEIRYGEAPSSEIQKNYGIN